MVSIFSRIIAGELPAYKIYDDEHICAFLTIAPHTLGHTLVVPKQEISNILDLPDALYTHLMVTAKNIIAPALQKATECTRIGWLVEGLGVQDHAHLHLIPISQLGDMDGSRSHQESPDAMEEICQKIRSYIL